MNRDNIISLPHDSLRQRSKRVRVVNEDIKKLIGEMIEATIDWENHRDHEVSVGLAAVQVNNLYRVVIIREDFKHKDNKSFRVFIDPEIVKYEGETEEDFEGCLSVKDVYGKVPRYTKVRVKALDENGKEIRLKAEGYLARIFQHEVDHVNGKLFVDHIRHNPDAFYKLDDKGKIKELDDEEREAVFSILW